MPNSTLITFADDITVIGLTISDEKSYYRNEIELLVNWSNDNNLILNVDKTKEMTVDSRKSRNLKDPIIIIIGSAVKQVDTYKFVGLTVMNILSWTLNADKIIIKERERLFFLCILKVILKSYANMYAINI